MEVGNIAIGIVFEMFEYLRREIISHTEIRNLHFRANSMRGIKKHVGNWWQCSLNRRLSSSVATKKVVAKGEIDDRCRYNWWCSGWRRSLLHIKPMLEDGRDSSGFWLKEAMVWQVFYIRGARTLPSPPSTNSGGVRRIQVAEWLGVTPAKCENEMIVESGGLQQSLWTLVDSAWSEFVGVSLWSLPEILNFIIIITSIDPTTSHHSTLH